MRPRSDVGPVGKGIILVHDAAKDHRAAIAPAGRDLELLLEDLVAHGEEHQVDRRREVR